MTTFIQVTYDNTDEVININADRIVVITETPHYTVLSMDSKHFPTLTVKEKAKDIIGTIWAAQRNVQRT